MFPFPLHLRADDQRLIVDLDAKFYLQNVGQRRHDEEYSTAPARGAVQNDTGEWRRMTLPAALPFRAHNARAAEEAEGLDRAFFCETAPAPGWPGGKQV